MIAGDWGWGYWTGDITPNFGANTIYDEIAPWPWGLPIIDEWKIADTMRANKIAFEEYIRSLRPLILAGTLFRKLAVIITRAVYCRALGLIGHYQDRQRRARRKRITRMVMA